MLLWKVVTLCDLGEHERIAAADEAIAVISRREKPSKPESTVEDKIERLDLIGSMLTWVWNLVRHGTDEEVELPNSIMHEWDEVKIHREPNNKLIEAATTAIEEWRAKHPTEIAESVEAD